MIPDACACRSRARTLAALVLAAIAIPCCNPLRAEPGIGQAVAALAAEHGLIPNFSPGSIDAASLRAQDAADTKRSGDMRKHLRVARGFAVAIDTDSHGLWLELEDRTRIWMLTLTVPGAVELHLGFDRFDLPQGASLSLLARDGDESAVAERPGIGYTLWPGLVPGDAVRLVLSLPPGSTWKPSRLRLSYVGAGYRKLFDAAGPIDAKSGDDGCAVDVVCPLGDEYGAPARAVARYTFQRGGYTYLCTGSMVANTRGDHDPLFLTAHHCVPDAESAATVVLYFNYQSTECGDRQGTLPVPHPGGATLLATRTDVDTSLLRLASTPDVSLATHYAGWDRSGDVPEGSIGIDHPRGRVKSIVENVHPLLTTNSCIVSGTQSTHWRTSAYAQGATMPGSSGSMLLAPASDANGGGLITGVLSGGSSACNGAIPNQHGDCYGKLAVAWDGPDPASRLRDWLDPIGSSELRHPGYPGPRPDRILSSSFEG